MYLYSGGYISSAKFSNTTLFPTVYSIDPREYEKNQHDYSKQVYY